MASYDRCFGGGKSLKSMKSASKCDQINREEEKKIHSRSAAKARRGTESEIFDQLIQTLPQIDRPTIYQLDRIGALRLALTLLQTRRVAEKYFPRNESRICSSFPGIKRGTSDEMAVKEAVSAFGLDRCIDGFLMVVNKCGQLLYVTPGIAESIGFTQIDLIGRFLRDYIHAEDWLELREQLCKTGVENSNSNGSDTEADVGKAFFRIKTALTPRGGRARKLTTAVYQPVQAYIMKPSALNVLDAFDGFDAGNDEQVDENIRLIHCQPFSLSSPCRSTVNSSQQIFSKHEMDMKFRHADNRFSKLLGYKDEKSLLGTSYFDLIYPEDLENFVADLKKAFQKDHIVTGYYRLLTRNGNTIWVESELYFMKQNIRGNLCKTIVCAHQFIGNSESVEYDCPTPEYNFVEPKIPIVDDCSDPIVFEQPSTQFKPELVSEPVQTSTFMPNEFEAIQRLAPFILGESQQLTPATGVNDPDMPGLVQFLDLGNPINANNDSIWGYQPNPMTDDRKPKSPDFTFDLTDWVNSDQIPLDFGDYPNPVQEIAPTEFDSRSVLITPAPKTLPDPMSPTDFTPTFSGYSRKRANTITVSDANQYLAKKQHRLDKKTVESFELEMILQNPMFSATAASTTSDNADDFFCDDDFEFSEQRARSRSFHHHKPGTVADKEIELIKNNLLKEFSW